MSSRVTVLARGTARVNVPTPAPDLVSQATGAWRAATVESDGRSLTDLTGAGRHMLAGGVAGSTPTTNDPTVLDFTGVRYMFLDGVSGNFASVPDEAALDIVGDLDISVDVALDDVTRGELAGKVTSYALYMTSSKLRLYYVTGSTAFFDAGIAHGLSQGERAVLRATRDASTGTIEYFNGGVSLGTSAGTSGNLDPSGAGLRIGDASLGVDIPTGQFYGATVKDGIDGTTVLDVDFARTDLAAAPYTTVTAVTGQTVTLQGRATLVTSPQTSGDGADDFNSVASDAVFNVGDGDFTATTVVRHRGLSSNAALIGKKSTLTSTDAGFMLHLDASENAVATLSDGTTQVTDSLATTVADVHTVAIRRTGDVLDVVVDGVASAGADVSTLGTTTNAVDLVTLAFGSLAGGFAPVGSWGHDIRGESLTLAEIAQVGRELAIGEGSLA